MQKSYLGVALAHPFVLQNGVPALIGDDALIVQSIKTLLSTPIGTKFMLPEWGSRCREVLFEPNDDAQEDLIQYFVADAIAKWETRVAFVSCEFNRDGDDVLNCLITYRNLKSNEINSFVYPFYKNLKY